MRPGFQIFHTFNFRWGRFLAVGKIFLYLGSVYLKLIFAQRLTGFIAFPDRYRSNWPADPFFNFISFRARIIGNIACFIDPCIVNYRCFIDNRDIIGGIDIVVIDIPSAKISASDKCPLIAGYIIAITIRYIDADSWSDRSPSIVI